MRGRSTAGLETKRVSHAATNDSERFMGLECYASMVLFVS